MSSLDKKKKVLLWKFPPLPEKRKRKRKRGTPLEIPTSSQSCEYQGIPVRRQGLFKMRSRKSRTWGLSKAKL